MLSIIENNPFRILGVYSNAEQSEIIRNERKIRAYINVGKPVSMPSDFEAIIECPGQPFYEWEKGFDHLEFITSAQGVPLRDFIKKYSSVYAIPSHNHNEGFLVAYDDNHIRKEIGVDISYDLDQSIQMWCAIGGEDSLLLDKYMIDSIERKSGSLEIVKTEDKKLVLCESRSEPDNTIKSELIVGYRQNDDKVFIYNSVEELFGKDRDAFINFVNENKAYLYIKKEGDRSFLNKFVIDRSIEVIESAISKLSTAQDKVRYSLFWFVKVPEFDEIALERAREGDIKGAISYIQDKWEEGESTHFSYHLNMAVLSLIDSDYYWAIKYYMNLIHSDEERESFLQAVVSAPTSFSANDLSKYLLDELLSLLDPLKLHEYLYDLYVFGDLDWDSCSFELAYTKDYTAKEYVSHINSRIKEIASFSDNDQGEVRTIILNHAKPSLEKLRTLLGENDPLYSTTADNLAKQIIQFAINSFNNKSNQENDLDRTLELLEYANEITDNDELNRTCHDSIKKLKERKDNIIYVLSGIIEKFLASKEENSIALARKFINDCAPLLQQIKEESRNNYIQYSCVIVQAAMNMIIDVVNDAQNKLNNPLYGDYECFQGGTIDIIRTNKRYSFDLGCVRYCKKVPYDLLISIVNMSVETFQEISSFDMSPSLIQSFNSNREKLLHIKKDLIDKEVVYKNYRNNNYLSKEDHSMSTTNYHYNTNYNSKKDTNELINGGVGKILGYISLIGGLIAFIMMGIIGLNG